MILSLHRGQTGYPSRSGDARFSPDQYRITYVWSGIFSPAFFQFSGKGNPFIPSLSPSLVHRDRGGVLKKIPRYLPEEKYRSVRKRPPPSGSVDKLIEGMPGALIPGAGTSSGDPV